MAGGGEGWGELCRVEQGKMHRRGARDGARDHGGGQGQPPPPFVWSEVEMGMLQPPGDKLRGGLL